MRNCGSVALKNCDDNEKQVWNDFFISKIQKRDVNFFDFYVSNGR